MTKQTKWPTHVAAATWPPHRVARRVTAWQRRADWLPGARHHRTGAWRAKNSKRADVSVTTPAALSQGLWRGEGGAFHSAGLLTSHTHSHTHTHTHSHTHTHTHTHRDVPPYSNINIYIYIYIEIHCIYIYIRPGMCRPIEI